MNGLLIDSLLERKDYFENNIERCAALYRALCGNKIISPNVAYLCSRLTASKICAMLHGSIDDRAFFLSELEGVVSDEIREILNQLGWEIESIHAPTTKKKTTQKEQTTETEHTW